MSITGKSIRRGMTLIEILMVMSIMTLLVSTLVVAAFVYQKHAQVKATEGVMRQIAQALEQFKLQSRQYPDDDGGEPYSTGDLWLKLEEEGKLLTVEARYKAKKGALGTHPKTNAPLQYYEYVDSWKKPLRYECSSSNQLFRLVSNGPDLVPGTGDDIVHE